MTEVIMLIGAPGSGKSTFGEKYAKDNNYVYLSSDKNRARLGAGESDQSVSGKAFELLKTEMEQALDDGKNVVLDATFISKKARYDFVKSAKLKKSKLKAVSFELPRDIIVERNAKRAATGGRNVPLFVIDRMLTNYEVPSTLEFDEIQFIRE